MKVLVVGNGGREHALVWKLRQSPRVTRLFCAPGNAGTARLAESVDISASDVGKLVRFAEEERIDLTVAGPELPLTLGLVDELEGRGRRGFGPSRAAAQLEGSKSFAKDVMRRCRVPTAFYSSFTEADDADRYVDEVGAPIVVKADGLAAGKGVVVCNTVRDAKTAINEIMRSRLFGDAGDRVVIEEYLEGEEVSFMAVSDGENVLPLASSQDHKRVGDGDTGPNTGGMGAYSPAPLVTESLNQRVLSEVMEPVVRGMAARGVVFRGVLYAGLMMCGGEPKVLEFNVRFGDPESQALLLRLQSDLFELMWSATEKDGLRGRELAWDARSAACVVLAAGGYPGPYENGKEIKGLEALVDWRNGVVFHAGTALKDGLVVTSGGRVLGVTALGNDITAAVGEAYRAVEQISWEGMHFRRDIGRRAMEKVT